MLRANRVLARRAAAPCSRHLSTARPDAGSPLRPTPSGANAPNAPPSTTAKLVNGPPSSGAPGSSTSASSASSGPGLGSLLILTALSAPAATALYLKQNPQWNPEAVKHDPNWVKFREFVLGDQAKAKPANVVPREKAIAPAAKATPRPPKELSKSPEELSALISKANPSASLGKSAEPSPTVNAKTPEKEKPAVKAKKTSDKEKEAIAPKETKEADAKPVSKKTQPTKQKGTEVAAGKDATKAAEAKDAQPVAPATSTSREPSKPVVVKKVDDAVARERRQLDKLAVEATPEALGTKVDKQIQSTTKEIVETLQGEANAAAMDVDKNYLHGIHELDANALAIRVAQLATEMKHRSKWEAVRLLEALRRMEEDAKKKSAEVLERQQMLHKELLERELRLQGELLSRKTREEMDSLKKQYAEDLARAVKEHTSAITKEVQEKFSADKKKIEDRFAQQLRAKSDELQKTLADERQQRVKELENYRAQLRALNAVLERTSTYEAFSHQVHKASMAALALSDRIEAAGPLRSEIKALREFARNDQFVDAALKTLPAQVIEEGAPSVGQLQERFKTVKIVGRRASLIPENSGPIEGNDADAIFSRADYALKAGDIEKAVGEMKGLTGLPAEVSRDWIAAAESRLAVEQTAKVVKAHISLLAASCS